MKLMDLAGLARAVKEGLPHGGARRKEGAYGAR